MPAALGRRTHNGARERVRCDDKFAFNGPKLKNRRRSKNVQTLNEVSTVGQPRIVPGVDMSRQFASRKSYLETSTTVPVPMKTWSKSLSLTSRADFDASPSKWRDTTVLGDVFYIGNLSDGPRATSTAADRSLDADSPGIGREKSPHRSGLAPIGATRLGLRRSAIEKLRYRGPKPRRIVRDTTPPSSVSRGRVRQFDTCAGFVQQSGGFQRALPAADQQHFPASEPFEIDVFRSMRRQVKNGRCCQIQWGAR